MCFFFSQFQGLPHLKKLWLEENPCVEGAGPTYALLYLENFLTEIVTIGIFIWISYRSIVLRALPNLEMLDNVCVTAEELADAMKGGHAVQSQEDVYEDAYSNGPSQQQAQQQQQQSQYHQQQQQQYRHQSPVREVRTPFIILFNH